MAQLQEAFLRVWNSMDLQDHTSLFHQAPVGIRFEIGGEEEIYLGDGSVNSDYLKNANTRVQKIYDSLPHPPNILRIDRNLEVAQNDKQINLETLYSWGFPAPDEIHQGNKVESVMWDDVEEIFTSYEFFYWDLSQHTLPLHRLFQEIILGDLGGISSLVSSVYGISTIDGLCFHLYDDRGADVVAVEKESLQNLYEEYRDWVLPYDKSKTDLLFS